MRWKSPGAIHYGVVALGSAFLWAQLSLLEAEAFSEH